jgi:hypothetical protein
VSEAPKTTPLAYDRPQEPIPRWQFRLLFLLVLLNLAITIQSTYAPGVAASVRAAWANYRESRRVQALQQQVWNWTEPPTKVVWDDDPATAAPLLRGSGYVATGVPASLPNNYPFLAGWPPGAAAKPPPVFKQLFPPHFPHSKSGLVLSDGEYAVAFMHRLKGPLGVQRLVYVYVTGETDMRMIHIPVPPGPQTRLQPVPAFDSTVRRNLHLVAVPCTLSDGPAPPQGLSNESTVLMVRPGRGADWTVPWKWVPSPDGKGGQVRVDPIDRFRFYAGQLDPADPSHFTIKYDLDAATGTIHGRLKDDGTVDLRPEQGTVSGDAWDPRAM